MELGSEISLGMYIDTNILLYSTFNHPDFGEN